MIPQQERDALSAEVERLKVKLGGPDYLLKLDTYEDTIRELMHELAVRERQAEIFDEEWDGRHTVESALSQARVELAKETTIARVDEIEEAYHSADDSKLVFKEVKP